MSAGKRPDLEVRVEYDDGVAVVIFRGELDVATGAAASSALTGLSGDAQRVVVDLSGLEFVDSSGVKMLVSAARAVEDAGGSFVVCGAGLAVGRVIEILRVGDVVTVVQSRDDALIAVVQTSAASDGVS
jgi:anti-anti-sigma factor